MEKKFYLIVQLHQLILMKKLMKQFHVLQLKILFPFIFLGQLLNNLFKYVEKNKLQDLNQIKQLIVIQISD